MSESIVPRPLTDEPGSVGDGERLLRIVPRKWVDPTSGGAQSIAFQDQTLEIALRFGLAAPCMSVAIESDWLVRSGRVEDLLVGWDQESYIAVFTAGQMRALRTAAGHEQPQGVMHHAVPGAPWHAVVWDLAVSPRNKSGRRAIAGVAQWFRRPDESK